VKRIAPFLNLAVLISLFLTIPYPVFSAEAIEGMDELKAEKLSQNPIEITAKELVAERQKRRVIFKGDVIATQNSLFIYSDSLTAEYDEEGKTVARIEAIGNVRVVQKGIREAQGDMAIFINEDQTVELSGNTIVSEGDSKLLGEKLIIYIAENRSIIFGGENGRVKAIINTETFMEEKEEKKDQQEEREK
jgi:lipopolysaccharide export system protein LptA